MFLSLNQLRESFCPPTPTDQDCRWSGAKKQFRKRGQKVRGGRCVCVSLSHASGFVLCISMLSVFKHIFWISRTNSSHLPVQKTSWTSWNKGSLRRRRCSIPFSPNWTRSLTGEWPVCTWSGFQLCEHHSLFKQWCLLYVYNEDLNTSVNEKL